MNPTDLSSYPLPVLLHRHGTVGVSAPSSAGKSASAHRCFNTPDCSLNYRVLVVLLLLAIVGWGACSLRACSDRLFESSSLQAFVAVFGSLLDLHFGILFNGFVVVLGCKSCMADGKQHAKYKQQLI